MTESTPSPIASDLLLRVPEVADRLGSSKGYVYQLMRSGQLGYVEMPPGIGSRGRKDGTGQIGRRVKESELNRFISGRTVEATALEARAPDPK